MMQAPDGCSLSHPSATRMRTEYGDEGNEAAMWRRPEEFDRRKHG